MTLLPVSLFDFVQAVAAHYRAAAACVFAEDD
jgi:hypothetical protein